MLKLPSRNSLRVGRSTAATVVFILFGPIVWALHLLVIYGSQSVLCARGGTASISTIIGVATLVSIAALCTAAMAPGALAGALRVGPGPGSQQAFINGVAVTLAILSLFGVVWAAATIFILPSCLSLR